MDFSNQEKVNQIKSKDLLDNIKSKYFIDKIFDHLKKSRYLEIIKCSKKIQHLLNLNLKSYKEFSKKFTPIEIELIPIKKSQCNFINPISEEQVPYYHIY